MNPWHDDGDGYQTFTCSCGRKTVAAIITSGPVDIRKCRCGEPVPEPPKREEPKP